MKVVGWVDQDSSYPNVCSGFHVPKEYITPLCDEIKEKGYKFCGITHQNYEKGCPLFSNGKVLRCTQRTWGDIMAMCWEKNYAEDKYAYVLWAWDVPDRFQICVPR